MFNTAGACTKETPLAGSPAVVTIPFTLAAQGFFITWLLTRSTGALAVPPSIPHPLGVPIHERPGIVGVAYKAGRETRFSELRNGGAFRVS